MIPTATAYLTVENKFERINRPKTIGRFFVFVNTIDSEKLKKTVDIIDSYSYFNNESYPISLSNTATLEE